MNYYNEHDPNAAAWLRQLIRDGLIPAGDVDERDIQAVQANDIRGYTQKHFFAGIGGWSLALRLAGWPDEKPIVSASLPCQPWSGAGLQKGEEDERHLWPVFFDLTRQIRPECIVGEQVERAVGLGWLDGISADLETEGYAVGSVVLGAHSVSAPHMRQRIYWVAYAKNCDRRGGVGGTEAGVGADGERWRRFAGGSTSIRLADSEQPRLEGHAGHGDDRDQSGRDGAQAVGPTATGGAVGRLGNSKIGGFGVIGDAAQSGSGGHTDGAGESSGLGYANGNGCQQGQPSATPAGYGHTFEPAGFWGDSIWHLCRDGKHRRIPVEPTLFPLADGLSYKLARRRSIRPALLKGAGNAIVAEVAAEFIIACHESIAELNS